MDEDFHAVTLMRGLERLALLCCGVTREMLLMVSTLPALKNLDLKYSCIFHSRAGRPDENAKNSVRAMLDGVHVEF